jgi:enoyl-[acyl-carrier protein] reductase II
MYPDVFREQIRRCKAATSKPFAVNIPLLYPDVEQHMKTIVEEGVKIVFTSAGNPATWTGYLKQHGIVVVHVIANSRFAAKAEQAGVDALVAEGFEAGGHNGREETTTLVLLPLIRKSTQLPLIAAGGIADGNGMLAAFALGAEAVQMGTRFVASQEASCHESFKQRVVSSAEGETKLLLKKLTPVRMLANAFSKSVEEAESRGADDIELKELLGRARAKKGMFEGDMEQGELEIGQIAALVRDIKPAGQIVQEVWQEFSAAGSQLCTRLSNLG